MEEIEAEFAGRGYGDFKLAVGETVAAALAPIRESMANYLSDKGELERLMKEGADRAARIAGRTLQKAQKRLGLIPR